MNDLPFSDPKQRGSDGHLKWNHQNKLLKEEVKRLRALIDMDESLDEASWAASAPQETRDQYAAAAYMAEGLHPIRALNRLGFFFSKDAKGNFADPEERKSARALARRIFETPGCQAILHADAEKFSANKEAVMQNLYKIAVSPISKEADKVRAAGQLAKMVEGWQDGEKVKNPASVLNFLTQIVGSATVAAQGNGTRPQPLELPPGGDSVIDAEEFFVERDAEVAVVVDVDDSQEPRRLTR
jgi:hypothetical protein